MPSEQGLGRYSRRLDNNRLPDQADTISLPDVKILPPVYLKQQEHSNNNNYFSLSDENEILSHILQESIQKSQKKDTERLSSQEDNTKLDMTVPTGRLQSSRLEESHDDDPTPPDEDTPTPTTTPTPSHHISITTTTTTPPPSSTPPSQPTSTSPPASQETATQQTTTNTTAEDTTTQSIKSWLGWDEYLTISYLAVTVITIGGCLLGCLLGCLCLRSGIGGPGKVEETSRVFDSDDDD